MSERERERDFLEISLSEYLIHFNTKKDVRFIILKDGEATSPVDCRKKAPTTFKRRCLRPR